MMKNPSTLNSEPIPDLLALAFNDPDTDHLQLPNRIDPKTWTPPEGYHLEVYTDEAHLHWGDNEDPCAGWQAE